MNKGAEESKGPENTEPVEAAEKGGKPEDNESKSKKSPKKGKIKKASGVKFGLRPKFSLAIIALVFFVISSITVFFIWRESNLLKNQILQFVEREVVHLGNTAQQSIGVDELALISSINDLKKITYIQYAYVLNFEDNVIQYFDKRGEQEIGEPLLDEFKRKLPERVKDDKILVLEMKAEKGTPGLIIDFSKTVLNKLDQRKIGTVIIGISDIVIRKEIESLIKVIIPISLMFLVISIVGSIVLATVTIRPIRILSHGAAEIGQGNLDYHIKINTSDELGQLANEFNIMTAQIKEAKDKEIESRVMEDQLKMAQEIQEGLNPMGFYNKNGVQIKGYTKAAKGVGGDYFDYIDISENKIGALISDVSGKGVAASLVMVMIRTVFTSEIKRDDMDCARVTSSINDSLSADFAIDKFATLFFMIYDRETEELAFSNAGHGPLFCYRASKGVCTETKLDGVPIGIMEDVDYLQAKVKLNPGDMIILYTDGVTEMRNMDKDEYGIDRVQEMMIKNNNLTAEEFADVLFDDLEKFRGEAAPHDDTTFLVFKRSE